MSNARDYILNQGFVTAPIETPFWPELEGQLVVREMSGAESLSFEKSPNDPRTVGALIVAVLLDANTKQPIFQPTDAEFVMNQVGVSKILPLVVKAAELSGADKKAIDAAKNGSSPTPLIGSI